MQVLEGSAADTFGIQAGDVIMASSATAGDQLWSHDSAEGVRSALSTRFVMNSSVMGSRFLSRCLSAIV